MEDSWIDLNGEQQSRSDWFFSFLLKKKKLFLYKNYYYL